MKVQVLASVMQEEPLELAQRMRLESDAVVVNQCHRLGYEELEYRGHLVRFFSFPDRGTWGLPWGEGRAVQQHCPSCPQALQSPSSTPAESSPSCTGHTAILRSQNESSCPGHPK